MNHMAKPTFEEELIALEKEVTASGLADESEQDIAEALWQFTLEYERRRHRVKAGTPEGNAVDRQTHAAIMAWDSNDSSMSTLEKALRRLAEGRGLAAVGLLKDNIIRRSRAAAEEQRRKAKSPRRKHPVDALIEDLVRADPQLSAKQVQRALEAKVGRGVIASMDDEEIVPTDAAARMIKVDGLPDRLTRIKKRIARAG
jgi:hypothetical protein